MVFRVTLTPEYKKGRGETELRANLPGLASTVGVLGIPEGLIHPRSKQPLNRIAVINEFGAPSPTGRKRKGAIPARPAVTTTLRRNKFKYYGMMGAAAKKFLKNKSSGAQQIARTLAAIVWDVQYAIENWSDPPNAARTIRRKGFDDPLVETHLLARSFTFRSRTSPSRSTQASRELDMLLREIRDLVKALATKQEQQRLARNARARERRRGGV